MTTYRIGGNPQQGYEVHAPWGATVSLGTSELKTGATAHAVVSLPSIRSVGLDDLRDVQSHRINRIAQSTSHVVCFIGGGSVEFAYNDRGELLELRARSAQVHIDVEGRLSFCPYRPPQPGEPSASH